MTVGTTFHTSWVHKVALASVGTLAVVLGLDCLHRLYTDTVHTDFAVLYESGRAWMDGKPPYALFSGGCNLSPPVVLPLFIALAHLPYRLALTILLAASVVAIGFSVRTIMRELELRLSWDGLVAGLLFMGTLQVLREGNIPWLLALPAALAWRAARNGRWPAAGVWLGLCLTAKPIFGWFVFALAIRRHKSAALAAAGISALGVLSGLVMFGPAMTRDWLAVGARVTWFGVDTNVSILSILTRSISGGHFGLLFLGIAVFVLAMSTLALVGSDEDVDRDWSIVWLASLLVAPLGWVYYYWLAAGPLLARFRTARTPWVVAAGLALLPHSVRADHPAAAGPAIIAAATIGSAFFWATVVFWIDALRDVRRGEVTLIGAPLANTRL